MTLYIALLIVPIVIGIWAQAKVKSTYGKYSKVGARSGITGREAAAYVMRNAGIDDVEIVAIRGTLTDHYDPSKKRLALSEQNYHGQSLAALGVAAHEAGHAIQHKQGYAPLNARMTLVPVTSIASNILPWVIIGGFFLGPMGLGLIKVAVVIFLILAIFQLITLPVEFDASRRASAELSGLGIITADEMHGVKSTLNAAGWTYVAALVATLANLAYYFLISRD